MADPSVFELKDNQKLYAVLGIAKGATESEIKRAYHKLAIKWHPDKNPADGGEKFKEISFAHAILSDPEQRRMYDANTLRTHIEGAAAKERDPEMDPNVELSPEDLRKFVEKVQKQASDRQQRMREFEKRREEELRRRAEWELLNPGFQMPDLAKAGPSASVVEHQRTTADMHKALEKVNRVAGLPSTYGVESAEPADDDADGVASSSAAGSPLGDEAENVNPAYAAMARCDQPDSHKARMMAKFRATREEKGVAPSVVPRETKQALETHYERSKVTEVKATAKPNWDYEVEKVQTKKMSTRQYKAFVEDGYTDGGNIIRDAVLADALDGYTATTRAARKP